MNNPWLGLSKELVYRPGDALEVEPPPRPMCRGHEPGGPATHRHALDLPEIPNPWGLSPAQCAVMSEYVKGLTAKEIGDVMGRSFKTIEVHLCSVRQLMGNVKRVQMAILWDRFEQSRIPHPAETAQPYAGNGD